MDDTMKRMELFRQMLKCVNMDILTEFGPDFSVLESTSGHADVLELFFADSASRIGDNEDNINLLFDNMENIERHEERQRPVVFLNRMGMAWISDVWIKSGCIQRIYMLGPVFLDDFSAEHIEQELNRFSLSVSLKRRFLEFIYDMPVISVNKLYEYGMMMHYCITKKKISAADFLYPYQDREDQKETAFASKHGTYAVEKEILSLVEEGNLNYQEVWDKYISSGELGKTSSGGYLRQQKNIVIMFTTLCSRAAICGGLSPETSYSLCDGYMRETERAKNLAQLVDVSHTMFRDYVIRVHRHRSRRDSISPQIGKVCDYIGLHLGERLDIHFLAQMVDYSDYYFSSKFKKELGVSVRDYVMNSKIERAKYLLKDAKMSISEISDELGYGSQNHFAGVFRKFTGMSPSEYREQA